MRIALRTLSLGLLLAICFVGIGPGCGAGGSAGEPSLPQDEPPAMALPTSLVQLSDGEILVAMGPESSGGLMDHLEKAAYIADASAVVVRVAPDGMPTALASEEVVLEFSNWTSRTVDVTARRPDGTLIGTVLDVSIDQETVAELEALANTGLFGYTATSFLTTATTSWRHTLAEGLRGASLAISVSSCAGSIVGTILTGGVGWPTIAVTCPSAILGVAAHLSGDETVAEINALYGAVECMTGWGCAGPLAGVVAELVDDVEKPAPPASTWSEDFESYSQGTWPQEWTADANADSSASGIDNTVSHSGSKSLKLFGSIGGCWGALAYRPLNATPPYEIELYVRNGNDALSGCHPERAYIGLRKGTSWANPARMLLEFQGDGTIHDRNGDSLGTYSTLDWIKVKLKYERPTASTVRVTYWIDDVNEGSVTYTATTEENNLTNLDLTVQEGTVWFDDVRVTD